MTTRGMSEEEALDLAMQSNLFQLVQPSSYGSLGQFQASMDPTGKPLGPGGKPYGMIDPRTLASFQGDVSDLLTDDDIADILREFDLQEGQYANLPGGGSGLPYGSLSQANVDAQLMRDFGM